MTDLIFNNLVRFRYNSLTRFYNKIKSRGYLAGDLINVLTLLPFMGVLSIRALYLSGLHGISQAKKDAFYRLINNETINWRFLLYCFARQFTRLVEKHGKPSNGKRCLILDDTLWEKTGRKIEGIGKVYDHATHRIVLGLKCLTLGWWDGKSFIPLDFSIHREKGKNKSRPYGMTRTELRNQFRKKRKKDSEGSQRKKELDSSKIEQSVKHLRRAISNGFVPDYVLADSWFFCRDLLQVVNRYKKKGVHLICKAKYGKIKFEHDSRALSPKQIRSLHRGEIKRCKAFRAKYIQCSVKYHGIPLNLFFVRYSIDKNWKLVVTTDLNLSFPKLMEHYSIRWTIEVFFKEAKQYLRFGKCQSADFDAQIADATLTMIQYILLNLTKRFSAYETLGGLFRDQQDKFTELTLASRLWAAFRETVTKVCNELGIDPDRFIRYLLEHLANTENLPGAFFFNANNEHEKTRKNAA